MNDTPYARGGLIPSPGPDSDLIPVVLSHGEPVLRSGQVSRWLEQQGVTRDFLREYGITWTPEEEADDDDAS